MVNSGFKLTATDCRKLSKFKSSIAYSTYLKAIKNSPAYVEIMREHIAGADIRRDIEKLQKEGTLPSTVSADALDKLFRETLSRMAIGILADSLILKELEDKNTDDVLNEIRQDANIIYLLGLGDPKFYKEVERLVEEGKVNKDDIAFRGLMAYLKRKEIGLVETEPEEPVESPCPRRNPPSRSKSEQRIDYDSLDIELE